MFDYDEENVRFLLPRSLLKDLNLSENSIPFHPAKASLILAMAFLTFS
jgi:hypothetical protein